MKPREFLYTSIAMVVFAAIVLAASSPLVTALASIGGFLGYLSTFFFCLVAAVVQFAVWVGTMRAALKRKDEQDRAEQTPRFNDVNF